MDPKALEIKNRFSTMALENRFPHAILLEGGNPKSLLALANQLAMIAVCTDPQKKPCNQCAHCKKAKTGNHPDIITVLETDKKRKSISVDLIRWLREDAIVQPNEAPKKVYLIPKAETMTREAQNALLKLLEEPPAYAVFLLLCDQATAMLSTIRSRSQIYSLEDQVLLTASAEDLAAKIAQAIIAPTEAALVLETAPLVKAKDREKFQSVLDGLSLILRDACVLRAGTTSLLSNATETAQALSKAISHRGLVQMMEELQQIRMQNERNCNLPLLITCMCTHLRQLASG